MTPLRQIKQRRVWSNKGGTVGYNKQHALKGRWWMISRLDRHRYVGLLKAWISLEWNSKLMGKLILNGMGNGQIDGCLKNFNFSILCMMWRDECSKYQSKLHKPVLHQEDGSWRQSSKREIPIRQGRHLLHSLDHAKTHPIHTSLVQDMTVVSLAP